MRRLILLLAAVLLAGCGGDGSASQSTAESATTEAQTTTAPKVGPRCLEATTVITHAIDTGLKGKGRTLTDVYAVKTNAYGSVFFVTARIKGAPATPIGTWATKNLNLGGLMFSVDPVAKKLSKWGNAALFDTKLTMKADGARESRACVKSASG